MTKSTCRGQVPDHCRPRQVTHGEVVTIVEGYGERSGRRCRWCAATPPECRHGGKVKQAPFGTGSPRCRPWFEWIASTANPSNIPSRAASQHPPLYQDLLLQAWPSGFTMPDVASLCVHSGSRDFGDNTCYVLRCLGAVYSITTFIRALTCSHRRGGMR